MNSELLEQARERLEQELRAQAEQIHKFEQSLQNLRKQHRRLEKSLREQFDALEAGQATGSAARVSFEKILGAVQNLITSTDSEQVSNALTEEAERMGVRAAVFDVRGRAAWGFAAKGFGSSLTPPALRALVAPLNQDTPFRKVYETGGHVMVSAEELQKNRNVLQALAPPDDASIALLPIRSSGSVAAIVYCDSGSTEGQLPLNALRILTEFAGAQLDRLMGLSGEMPVRTQVAEEEHEQAPAEPEPVAAAETPGTEPATREDVKESVVSAESRETVPAVSAEAAPAPAPEPEPAAEVSSAGEEVSSTATGVESPAAGTAEDQPDEAEQKIHKDARRFSKLLVAEIELYNKSKVVEGRKNKDLYRRLKTDIDRSRQTYEKRFGHSVAKKADYFHEELVRILADNDPSLFGPDYPGPSS